jgi:hypothetical protein
MMLPASDPFISIRPTSSAIPFWLPLQHDAEVFSERPTHRSIEGRRGMLPHRFS